MKYFFLSLFILICVIVKSQEPINDFELPATVRIRYSSMYDEVKKPKWFKTEDTYEVEFYKEGRLIRVIMDKKGHLIEKHILINEENYPRHVKAYFTKKHKGERIEKLFKIISSENEIKYMAIADNHKYIFDSEGDYIRKYELNENEKKQEPQINKP